MKQIVTSSLVALSLLAAGSSFADCGKDHGKDHAKAHGSKAVVAEAAAPALKEVSVAQLSELLADGKVVVFDANSAETRTKLGVVPGAKLLASSSEYDLAMLPSDKSQMLVFYCANSRCTASDKAAERAQGAGFTNVAVLRVGIKGWADAGKATSDKNKS